MENEIIDKPDLIQKISNIVKRKKKLLLSILFIITAILSAMIFLNYNQDNRLTSYEIIYKHLFAR